MSNNRLVFEGLEELRAALRRLPDELAGEASHIVEASANAAAAAIKAGYHALSGDLRDRLHVTQRPTGRFGAAVVVENKAKHAWIYDNGSQARHYITKSGRRHNTGAMWGRTPPTHLFVQTVIRRRRQMYEQLKAMLTRHGLEVSGNV